LNIFEKLALEHIVIFFFISSYNYFLSIPHSLNKKFNGKILPS